MITSLLIWRIIYTSTTCPSMFRSVSTGSVSQLFMSSLRDGWTQYGYDKSQLFQLQLIFCVRDLLSHRKSISDIAEDLLFEPSFSTCSFLFLGLFQSVLLKRFQDCWLFYWLVSWECSLCPGWDLQWHDTKCIDLTQRGRREGSNGGDRCRVAARRQRKLRESGPTFLMKICFEEKRYRWYGSLSRRMVYAFKTRIAIKRKECSWMMKPEEEKLIRVLWIWSSSWEDVNILSGSRPGEIPGKSVLKLWTWNWMSLQHLSIRPGLPIILKST